MAYSETIKLVQGDTLPQIKITLRDENTAAPGKTLDEEDPSTWAVINLAGCSVRMKVREIGSEVVKETLTGAITNAAGGEAVFIFDGTTLDTSGVFEAEIEYTNAGGATQTVYDLLKLQVREEF